MDIPTGPHFMFITFILIYYPATQHNTDTYFLSLFFLCKKPLRFFISFGIYLIHPFFMLVAYKLIGPRAESLLGAALAFLMSWAAVALLRRIPLFARVT